MMKRLLYILLLMPLAVGAQKKVTDLPQATSVGASDKVMILQDGVSKQATVSQLPSGGGAASGYGLYYADDYASLQAAVDAMPARGGVLVLSNSDYTLTSQLAVSKPVKFVGGGSEDALFKAAATKITCSSNIDAVLITAPGVTFEDIAFVHSGTPTAGSAIKADNPGTDYNLNPNSIRIVRCSFRGFYDNVALVDGAEWYMETPNFLGAVRYNLTVSNTTLPDGGDGVISGGQFIAKAGQTAHIYQSSAGGLKVVGTKFNAVRGAAPGSGPAYCYLGEFNSGTTTTILQFTGCSLEGFTTGAIKVTGTSEFSQINITGNQFSSYTGNDMYYIDIDGPDGVNIVGNVFRCWTGSEKAVRLQNVSYYLVKPNTFWNLNGQTMITTASCTNEMVL